MTDQLIEQIKRDREAGTEGKWRVEYSTHFAKHRRPRNE
jgi:hypothetical protein